VARHPTNSPTAASTQIDAAIQRKLFRRWAWAMLVAEVVVLRLRRGLPEHQHDDS
jgi:hypothetical protein